MSEEKLENYAELVKFFVDEFSIDLLFGKRVATTKEEKILSEIFNRTSDIASVFDRLFKYPLYFKSFYSSDTAISEAESIQYHLHSYLSDIYSLDQKIKRLLGFLKNQIKYFKNVGNPHDVQKLLVHIESQVSKGLTQANKVRGENVHNRTVSEPLASRAQIIFLLKKINTDSQHEQVLETAYKKNVEDAKIKHIEQATKNNSELKKVKDFFAARIGHVIAFLFDKDIKRFTNMIEDEQS